MQSNLAQSPTDMHELAREYRRVKDALDELRAKTTAETKTYTDYLNKVTEQLYNAMINNDVQRFTLDGDTFFPLPQTHANLPADMLEDFISELEQRNMAGIVKPVIHHGTLTAFAKEQIERNGGALPDWIEPYVTIYVKHGVGMRRGK